LIEIRSIDAFDNIPVVIFSNEYDFKRISDICEYRMNRSLYKLNLFKTPIYALKRTIESIKNSTLNGIVIINYRD